MPVMLGSVQSAAPPTGEIRESGVVALWHSRPGGRISFHSHAWGQSFPGISVITEPEVYSRYVITQSSQQVRNSQRPDR
jgi:hypothetical protein